MARYQAGDPVWIRYRNDEQEAGIVYAEYDRNADPTNCPAHGDVPAYIVTRTEDLSRGLYCEPQLIPRENTR